MRALVWPAGIVATALLLATVIATTPETVRAACGGGGFDEGWLARRAGRNADTIALARLLKSGYGAYHFDVLTVYRGEAVSPIEVGDIYRHSELGGVDHYDVIDLGGCTRQEVEPGERFVYASWIDERHGPTTLIFPHVRGRGWIIEHFGATRSLDRLLGLLGVLPDTSTSTPSEPVDTRPDFGIVVAAFLGFAFLFYRRLGAEPATRVPN